jgi:hypothetical protein
MDARDVVPGLPYRCSFLETQVTYSHSLSRIGLHGRAPDRSVRSWNS